jgi:hypothetical protein
MDSLLHELQEFNYAFYSTAQTEPTWVLKQFEVFGHTGCKGTPND